MNKAEVILKNYVELNFVDKVPSTLLHYKNVRYSHEDVIKIMDEYTQQVSRESGCKCNRGYWGWTTIKCCNNCGKPIEKFWVEQ